MKFFVRSAYNYDPDEASLASGLEITDVSLTKQAFAEECDINEILRRFGISHELPVSLSAPTYGDFTGVRDFHSALNAIASANERFDEMPANVRARFDNNPGKFVDFCSDEGNRAEAIKLGLVFEKAVAVEPVGISSVGSSGEPAVVPKAP